MNPEATREQGGVLFRMFVSGTPLAPWASCAIALALVAAAVLVNPRMVGGGDRFPPDEHAKASFDLAVNLSLCGRAAVRSTAFPPARYILEHPDAARTPLPELLEAHTGSVGGYCATLTEPITNNEESLMLLSAAVLRLRPTLSADGLARAMSWLRVVFLLVFAIACVRAGSPVVVSLLVILAAGAVIADTAIYQFTVYPFLFPMLLAWIGLCELFRGAVARAGTSRLGLLGLVAGLVAGLGANLRTSYVPIYLSTYAVMFVIAQRGERRRLRKAAVDLAVGVLAVSAGLWLFNATIIRAVEHPAGVGTNNYTYHTIAHPLVMSLGVPQNPLSRSEDIRWNDMAGWEVARRVHPGVGYLGPEYERALYRFYFNLWRTRPRDMIATYWIKLLRTSKGVFLFASALLPDWRPLRKVYLVWADRVNGAEMMLATAALVLVAGAGAWRTGSDRQLLVSLAALTLFLVLLESALIYSEFFLAYHAFMLFAVLVSPAIALQAALDTWVSRRARSGA